MKDLEQVKHTNQSQTINKVDNIPSNTTESAIAHQMLRLMESATSLTELRTIMGIPEPTLDKVKEEEVKVVGSVTTTPMVTHTQGVTRKG